MVGQDGAVAPTCSTRCGSRTSAPTRSRARRPPWELRLVSVAVGWELYERTHDPWALGLVGIVQAGASLALTLPGGEASDRFPRRTVAMLAHALLGLGALGLALVSWLGGRLSWSTCCCA